MSNKLTIGRYELIEEIGRGAMSVVYLAKDPDIGRSLAIKLLKHDLVEKEEYRKLFLREARAAGGLSHPGIVTIYDVGIWQDRPYIAMELLEGKNLDDYLSEEGAMPLEDALEMAQQLTVALHYAHKKGVVHRDIKPENILVLDEGRRFKITDFGIARIEHQYMEGESEEEQAKVMGTPAYMSPEQISGKGTDFKTDLYSIGVILYKVTKGELPFEAANYGAMMQAVLQQNPQPLNAYSEQGFIWQSIIFRLLQKNPDLRYHDTDELIKELDALSKEIEQSGQGVGSIRFFSMRARWAIALSTLVLVVMVLGMFWVYERQNSLMNQLVYDYGSSMAQIISSETAEPLLLDENVALQAITVDIVENSDVLYLSIRDSNGLVQSSSMEQQVGKQHQLFEGSESLGGMKGSRIFQNADTFKQETFLFDTPISFQDKKIGFATIAIGREKLTSATRSSLLTMIIWMFVIMLAVFSGVYWLANKFTQRINKVRQAVKDIKTHGQADLISIDSHDEVGRLQQELNNLNQKLAGITKTQHMSVDEVNASIKEMTEMDKTVLLDYSEPGKNDSEKP
ncbi:serine/threonine protein kinase [Kangiella sediminilitoris]|uniref:Serine/threonine protein kinase n=1 Tax=Kangiella sediminilitoris TaxID=1144748 RepID=A0A1B3B8Z1_9GAMM|nr:serine/threonine-protein kinase [Kangiella sediminilitoris]AOE49268.1 Serine/threonine protein kinase [Kangiella sediminilitoris]